APDRWHLMVRTDAARLGHFLLRFERLAALAVKALVLALVDPAVVVDLLNELAAPLMVPRLARLDEIVVTDIERAPHLLELPRHFVAVGLGILSQLGGALRYLDRVFVVAHQEMDAKSLHAAIASLHIGAELLEGRADVR